MEIKFRGLRTDGKGWAYGDLLHDAFDGISKCVPFGIREKIKGHYNYSVEVIPETVGQFTGLTDRNGKEIYSRDIVTDGQTNGVVFYNDDSAQYQVDFNPYEYCPQEMTKNNNWAEVIGNVFEHPELLK